MTEKEWLRCADVKKMITFFNKRGSGRKWRLLALACCMTLANSLDEKCLIALDVLERYVDGLADHSELLEAHRTIDETAQRFAFYEMANPLMAVYNATRVVANPLLLREDHAGSADRALDDVRQAVAYAEAADLDDELSEALSQRFRNEQWKRRVEQESKAQCVILRDIFGNPFRPVAIDRRWLTSNVVDLSNAIYEGRTFNHLPILADALMDAGCDNDEILSHCRSEGPHVRGCWVVDLLTARS
jgi:hypothetical protein